MASLIGKTIAHYKILERIGAGGMGVVYKAEDTKLNRQIALKFLPPYALDNDEDRQRFTNEAQAAAALDHPNICTIYEISEAEGHWFIAMAFVDGQSLRDRIHSGEMTIEEAVDTAAQVASGLTAAHANGIVHRDIKPANIVLGHNGVAKIVDFGLAKSTESKKVTRTGSTLGTAAYMSPEQARGEVVDHRADIWSLGAILYEMLAGQPPFTGDHEAVVIYAILNEPLPSIREANPDVPEAIEQILERALVRDRADRYQDAGEMLSDLMQISGGPVSSSRVYTTAKVPTHVSQRTGPLSKSSTAIAQAPTKNRTLLFGAIGALAALIVLIGWLVTRDGPPNEASVEGGTGWNPGEALLDSLDALSVLDSVDWSDPRSILESFGEYDALAALDSLGLDPMQEFGVLPDSADSGAIADSLALADSLAADTIPPRIAVMYLENLSRNDDEDYFAAGMTEDIIIDLSNINDLRVLSRHDVRPYRGKPLSVRAMGEALKVDYLLEGAIRKEKNTLRMTMTLHNVAEERSVWAQRFDRPTDDIFRVQSEIADSIATVLAITLSTDEFKTLTLPPTNSVEAYDYYLQGRQYVENRSKEDNEQAEKMFKRAISKDENFALALVGLADTYLQRLDWGLDNNPKWLTEASPLLERAAKININSPELNMAFALYYSIKDDHSTAIQYARRAVAERPNNFEAHYLLGVKLVNAGLTREAGVEFKRTLELKSDFAEPYRWKAGIAFAAGEHKWVDRHIGRAMALAPDAAHILAWAAMFKKYQGELHAADSLIQRAVALKPETPLYLGRLGEVQLYQRKIKEAVENLQVAADESKSSTFYGLLGWAHHLEGDKSRSTKAFEQQMKILQGELKLDPLWETSQLSTLVARCRLGEVKNPETELARFADAKPSVGGVAAHELEVATVWAAVENAERTLAALETVIKGTVYSPAFIAVAPQFDFLKDNPRFRELVGQP